MASRRRSLSLCPALRRTRCRGRLAPLHHHTLRRRRSWHLHAHLPAISTASKGTFTLDHPTIPDLLAHNDWTVLESKIAASGEGAYLSVRLRRSHIPGDLVAAIRLPTVVGATCGHDGDRGGPALGHTRCTTCRIPAQPDLHRDDFNAQLTGWLDRANQRQHPAPGLPSDRPVGRGPGRDARAACNARLPPAKPRRRRPRPRRPVPVAISAHRARRREMSTNVDGLGYWCRQTFTAEITSRATRTGMRARLGNMPSSSPPRTVPAIEPAAMVSTKRVLPRTTWKLWSRL